MKAPIRVAVTGAAGNIGYAIAFRIVNGDLFGPDQPVIGFRMTSTRRFLARPSGVLLSAMGALEPRPMTKRRSRITPPAVTRYSATDPARRSESP